MKGILVGVDPGDNMSGLCAIGDSGPIYGANLSNSVIIEEIACWKDRGAVMVCMEDIKPYTGLFSPHVVETCKYIGELTYRLRAEVKIDHILLDRPSIKAWVYNTFPEICVPRVVAKILRRHNWLISKGKRGYQRKDGQMREPSHVFVDDRIVNACMRELWSIPPLKPGKSSPIGLKNHAYQALAVGSFYLSKEGMI